MATRGLSDKTFDLVNKIFVLIVTIIIIYPLVFAISASISDPSAVSTGKCGYGQLISRLKDLKLFLKTMPSGLDIETRFSIQYLEPSCI